MEKRLSHFVLAIMICGLSTSAAEYVERTIDATYKIFNPGSTGTGILFDAPEKQLVLVTAAHCFERMKGDHCLLVLRKRNDKGIFKRHDLKIAIRENGKSLWFKLKGHDVAALRIQLSAEHRKTVNPLPLSALCPANQVAKVLGTGDSTRQLGYPERFESHGAGFPVVRQACVASHPITPVDQQPTFMIDVTAFSGDSGGPIIIPSPDDATQPTVMGIVLSKHFNEERVTVSRHEDKVIKHPLGIATILHAHYVKQAIDGALK